MDAPETAPSTETPTTEAQAAPLVNWTAVGRWLLCYAVPLFLLGGLAWETAVTIVTDTAPVAMAPPEGYTAVKPNTTLVWHQNSLEGEFRVEVIEADGSYDRPEWTKTVNGSQVTIPWLDANKTWRWRVTHVSSGMTSNELSFRTGPWIFHF